MENNNNEELNLFCERWNNRTRDFWTQLIPYIEFLVSNDACNEVALKKIEISDRTKCEINDLFRNFFGENCKIPHPEVEEK